MGGHRSRARALAVALTTAALAVSVSGAAAARPASRAMPRSTGGSDAILAISAYEDFDPAVIRNGTSTPLTGVKPAPGKLLPGHFDDRTGGDVILYGIASNPDWIVHVAPAGDGVSLTTRSITVGGAFQPVVGDFDGNGVDDVLWYAHDGRDYLWLFDAAGEHTSTPVVVNGRYRPAALDANGDGRTDILWYSPGPARDYLWLFGPGAVPTSHQVSISGDYRTVVGPFGEADPGQPTDRVVFIPKRGSAWMWHFDDQGRPTSDRLPTVDGDYQPLGGQFVAGASGSIYLYGPGHLRDRMWAFDASGNPHDRPAPQVLGTYLPLTGDFDDNGLTDIALIGDRDLSRLWAFQPDGSVVGSRIDDPIRSYWASAAIDMR